MHNHIILSHVKGIVAKALDGQQYPLPLSEVMWVYEGKRGRGPKGANDLCLESFEAGI